MARKLYQVFKINFCWKLTNNIWFNFNKSFFQRIKMGLNPEQYALGLKNMLVDQFLTLKTCAFSSRLPDGGLLTSPWREDRTLVRFSGAVERVVAWVETAAHVPFTSTAARSQQRWPPTRRSCPSGTCKHRKNDEHREKKKTQVCKSLQTWIETCPVEWFLNEH